MKTITKLYKVEPYESKLLEQYFGGMRIGVFDIETLGLNPEFYPMVLSGMLTIEPSGECRITQYFAEKLKDEILIIEALRKDLETIDYLFTYNGRHFDLPFIEKRAKIRNLAPFHYNFYNLDLYLVLNGYSEIRYLLKNIRQKTVEDYMGLTQSRDDLISGADSVNLYKDYLECKTAKEKKPLMEKVLLHNHDDLLQLYKLLPILRQVDFHKAMNCLGFPVVGENGWPCLNVTRSKATNREFTIEGKYYGEPFSYIAYDTFYQYYSCEFCDDGSFTFKMPVDRHKRNSFINLKLYFDNFDDLKKYPCCINDFLLVTRGSETCYLESNMFGKKFLSSFINSTVCPVNIL